MSQSYTIRYLPPRWRQVAEPKPAEPKPTAPQKPDVKP